MLWSNFAKKNGGFANRLKISVLIDFPATSRGYRFTDSGLEKRNFAKVATFCVNVSLQAVRITPALLRWTAAATPSAASRAPG